MTIVGGEVGKSRQEAVENAPLLKIAGSFGYFRVQCHQAGSSRSKSANSSPARQLCASARLPGIRVQIWARMQRMPSRSAPLGTRSSERP